MSYRSLLSIPVSLALSTSLFAGTMGPVYEAPGFGGFYAGLGTGFISIFNKDEYVVTRPGFGVIRSGDHKATNTAVLFSGQVGYGWMLNPNTYLGVKGSIYYTPMENTEVIGYAGARGPLSVAAGQDLFTRSVKPIYNIDAVLGYEFFPHFLPFVEGGVSFANVKHHFVFDGMVADLTSIEATNYYNATIVDKYKTGYNVGLGASYLANANWIFSTEVVYHDFRKRDFSITNYTTNLLNSTHDRVETSRAVSVLASISYLIPG